MRIIRQKQEIPTKDNRPLLDGNQVNLLDYTEAISDGFIEIYQLLLKHRHQLLSSDNSPLLSFADDEIRVVPRNTLTYSLLLNDSFHPDLLRSAIDRDRLMDLLWSDIEYNPYLIKIIAAEQEDLIKGDIPIFTTHPNSRDLWSSSGQKITDFFDQPSMIVVQNRLQQLTQNDLEKQLWFIRASLTTLALKSDRKKWSSYNLAEPHTIANPQKLLSAANNIGHHLEKLALLGENDISWIGLTIAGKGSWSLTPSGIDLYSGISGIAIFFAHLGVVTQEKRYTNIAQVSLETIKYQLKERQSYITSIGAFEGLGSAIYTLAHLGKLWNRPELFTTAEELVKLLPDLIEKDEQLDIIGGSAGCIASLIALYECKPSLSVFAAAVQCGDHLLSQAIPMKTGIGFPTNMGKNSLTGFSHGIAGIAWALLKLSVFTGKERFRTTALRAIDYERSLFNAQQGNWPDLREFANTLLKNNNEQPICMTAWCHGAPGIGLARLHSLPYLSNTEIQTEIDTALKTTLKQGFGKNHSLCHGDLGNLELLLQASQTFDEAYWNAQVNRFSSIVLESIEQHGWLCGVPLGVETPGLMTGLAGIGYQLLRLAEPERVPSILMLELPKLKVR